MGSMTSIELQKKSLIEMETRTTFVKKLAGVEYKVLPRVYKGSTDTELMYESLKNKVRDKSVWEIGTGTGLVALLLKKSGAKYVLASDLNPDAILNVNENSKLLNLKIDTKQQDLFGDVSRKFDILFFNPPYTNNKINIKRKFEISFWDPNHKTVEEFIKNCRNYINPSGKVFIGWSSFAHVYVLRKIAKKYNIQLLEIGRKVGKRRFVYYVFELI